MRGKFLIIFSIIFIVIGAGLGIFGMYKLDWNFQSLDIREFEQKTYEHAEDQPKITKVIIDTNCSVNVVKGDKLKLTYYQENSKPAIVECDVNGVLKISNDYTYKWDWQIFKFKEFNLKYELTLPDGIDLEVNSINATLNIDGLNFGTINIDATNLSMTMNNCTGNNVNVESVNATLRLNNVQLDNLVCDTANLTIAESIIIANKIIIDSVNISMKLTVDGAIADYTVTIDAINKDKDINPSSGLDPTKSIKFDSANLGGYLKFTK